VTGSLAAQAAELIATLAATRERLGLSQEDVAPQNGHSTVSGCPAGICQARLQHRVGSQVDVATKYVKEL